MLLAAEGYVYIRGQSGGGHLEWGEGTEGGRDENEDEKEKIEQK